MISLPTRVPASHPVTMRTPECRDVRRAGQPVRAATRVVGVGLRHQFHRGRVRAGGLTPLVSLDVKLREDEVLVPAPGCEIRSVVLCPFGEGPRPGVLLYTDIFQLTDSTLRTARRLAPAGFVVCVPEIYPRGALAGVAPEFDDAGKQAGLAGAAGTTTSQFDGDRVAVLDFMEQRTDIRTLLAVGFCIGGHLAFRAAFEPRVAATVCFYPTGLHNGALGADADAGSLARAARIRGRLMIVFASQDPHVPADARVQIMSALYAAGLDDLELRVTPAASTRSCATSALGTTRCSPTSR